MKDRIKKPIEGGLKPHRKYHHGDLPGALLEAGIKIVRERGIEAVTLREVARQAKVSRAAPYHYFTDKMALVEALAVAAFRKFARALQFTWDNTAGTPLEKLARLGRTYVSFALEHPHEFRLMHMPVLRKQKAAGEDSSVSRAAEQAYLVLKQAVQLCQEQELIPGDDPSPYALTAWSSVHGLSVLLLDGLLVDGHNSDDFGDHLAQIVTQTLGIGLMPRK